MHTARRVVKLLAPAPGRCLTDASARSAVSPPRHSGTRYLAPHSLPCSVARRHGSPHAHTRARMSLAGQGCGRGRPGVICVVGVRVLDYFRASRYTYISIHTCIYISIHIYIYIALREFAFWTISVPLGVCVPTRRRRAHTKCAVSFALVL